jgi:hypothetical protein
MKHPSPADSPIFCRDIPSPAWWVAGRLPQLSPLWAWVVVEHLYSQLFPEESTVVTNTTGLSVAEARPLRRGGGNLLDTVLRYVTVSASLRRATHALRYPVQQFLQYPCMPFARCNQADHVSVVVPVDVNTVLTTGHPLISRQRINRQCRFSVNSAFAAVLPHCPILLQASSDSCGPRVQMSSTLEDAARRLHGRRPLPGHLHPSPRISFIPRILQHPPRRVPVLRCFSRLRPSHPPIAPFSPRSSTPQHRSFSPDHASMKPLTAAVQRCRHRPCAQFMSVQGYTQRTRARAQDLRAPPGQPRYSPCGVELLGRNVELSSPVQRGRLYLRCAGSASARAARIHEQRDWLAGLHSTGAAMRCCTWNPCGVQSLYNSLPPLLCYRHRFALFRQLCAVVRVIRVLCGDAVMPLFCWRPKAWLSVGV